MGSNVAMMSESMNEMIYEMNHNILNCRYVRRSFDQLRERCVTS